MKKIHEPITIPTPNIPREIIEDILSRIPIKCLIRFKSVCKLWHNLISDSHFVKFHLKQSVEERLMLVNVSLYSIDYKMSKNSIVELDYPMKGDRCNYFLNVLASCNGLVCISPSEDVFFLWNPSTNKSKKIPNSPIQYPSTSCTCSSIFYGLGYDHFEDDYKLVRIVLYSGAKFQTEVKMYTTRNNFWRQIQDFPYDFPHGRRGVFMNGALHWIVSLWSSELHYYMVAALDLAEEKYSLVKLPECEYEKFYFDIGVMGGNLFLFCCSGEISFDIWVMKEYGVTESWTRLKITVPCMTKIEAYAYLRPLCLRKNGEILLRVGASKLVLYDTKRDIFRDMVIEEGMPMPQHFDTVTFVESLVSPNVNSR